MKKEFNNNWHNLQPYIECKNCSFDMRLEAKEDTRTREVTYVYECTYSRCGIKEEVKDESGN